jgi:hypothetical protein
MARYCKYSDTLEPSLFVEEQDAIIMERHFVYLIAEHEV